MRSPAAILPLLVACALAGEPAGAATPEAVRAATRVQGLLRGIAGEYREAFDEDGMLARPIELEEAGLLVAEARDLLPQAGLAAADLDALTSLLEARGSRDDVDAAARALAVRVTAVSGVGAEARPPMVPSVARGAALFHDNCATCHGEHGAGDGGEAARLGIKPADFTNPTFMRGETPDDFFNVVTLGRRRSGMPSWGEALTVEQRWDAVRFVWTLHGTPEPARFDGACGGCHADATALAMTLAGTSDAAVFAAVSDATVGGGAHAPLASAAEADRWALVAAARARAFDGLVDPNAPVEPTPAATAPRETIAQMTELVERAVAARGDRAAATALATDAYMRFEPLEKRLGSGHPTLVRRIEEGFVRLRHALRDDGGEDVGAVVGTLRRDLDEAAIALEPASGAWIRFVESAGIILREGFEVVLVVGALAAYVRRSGTPAMVRSIHVGTAIGVVASAATAVVLATVLRLTPWAGEALEGVAMLFAAVVLFWVSYWLVSKSEADRWQRYIRGKVQSALTTRSGTALAAAAFLAVYREGFETILFYQALFASAPAGDLMIPAGLAGGTLLLAIVYLGLERIGLAVPIHAFFLWTGGFLYAMAIVFAGRGVAELQAAGVVPLTPLPWAPRLEVLGVFPSVETLAAQAIFVVLLVYAIVVTVRRRRTAAAERPAPVRHAAGG